MMKQSPGVKRFVALDRDGTIVHDDHYLSDPARLRLLPGAGAALRMLREAGFGLVVVTNQSGIARGYFDLPTLERIHARFHELLAAERVAVDAIYYCPHVEADGCLCRKPRTGMLDQAGREWGFDPRAAYVVGDRAADVELARAAGAVGVLVRTGYGTQTEQELATPPDHIADDLEAAARWLVGR